MNGLYKSGDIFLLKVNALEWSQGINRSVLRTAPISDSAVQPEPSGVYSSCPGLKRTASTNDFCADQFINLLKHT